MFNEIGSAERESQALQPLDGWGVFFCAGQSYWLIEERKEVKHMKNVAIVAAGVAMSLMVAVPVFARGPVHHDDHNDTTSVVVSNMGTTVRTYDVVLANTGLNFTGGSDEHRRHGHESGGSAVFTGSALAASEITTGVNYTQVGCGCDKNIVVTNAGANVMTLDVAVANSGANFTKRGFVHTGGATAGSIVLTDVNSTIIGSTP